jgi:predicted RND superfamily exporter protein
VLLLLPAMLAWSADHDERRRAAPRYVLHSFGTNRLTGACMRHPLAALAAGAALTVAALAVSRHLSFDESMATMRPAANRGALTSAEVGKRFGSGFDTLILSLSGRSPDEVLALSERAVAAARELVDSGVLQGVNGPSSLIPPGEHQLQVLAWLARQRSSALDMARIRGRFAAALRQEGLRPEAFTSGLDLLAEALSLTRPIGIADFAQAKQTELLLDRYLKKRQQGWRAAVYLYPPPDTRWRREVPPAVTGLAAALGPRAQLAGISVINQRIKKLVVRDAWIAGVLGLALVAVILWIDFRSFRSMALALAPLLVGIVWMVGGMAALGVQMNFINIFVTTMIIGIGTDYGIYVLHRYGEVRGEGERRFEIGLRETGKAVAAAAISTIVGFGSIVFSHYPGLQSTGKVAVLGAFFTSLVAITLVPAYLAWSEGRRSAVAAAVAAAPATVEAPTDGTAPAGQPGG